MDNFTLHMYTEIVFGKDAELQIGKKVAEHGGTKAMLVYGKGSIQRSGLYDRVANALSDEGIPFVELGGVQANPLLSKAREGVKLAKEENVDFLIGLGGGSAIDTAKGIALGIANDVDFWQEYYLKKLKPPRMTPVGVVCTLPATGTECSRSSVLRDAESGVKSGFMHAPCRPVFAMMNPELAYTLPPYQIAAGAADIFAHALERYFHSGESSIADGFGESVMRSVVKYSQTAVTEPTNYQAMAELTLASAMAHSDITGMGHGNLGLDSTCHSLERAMGGVFNTTHGEGLAVVMPAWMDYVANKGKYEKQAQIAENVFGVSPDPENPLRTALEGSRRMRAWLAKLGLASTLSEMGIGENDIMTLVNNETTLPGGAAGSYYPIGKDDFEAIYRSVR